VIAIALAVSAARAGPVAIVAVESVYGDIAGRIGGGDVSVTSVLVSADQDPHEFEASAETARLLARAKLVIYNGAGYDPWVARLLAAAPSKSREVIEIARVARRKTGDNPHLWYDAAAMSAVAAAIAAKLGEIDPAHRPEYAAGLAALDASMAPLREKIAAMRGEYAGTPVTATEPVFEYMADALGLVMRNSRFQLAVMNGTEPGASTIAAFERDLRHRAVKALLYNTQTGEALAARMRRIADEAGVPVVAMTETLPPGKTYEQWMLSQLDALDRALSRR
jgi:zinc/manganese transport system substrate-binding protein